MPPACNWLELPIATGAAMSLPLKVMPLNRLFTLISGKVAVLAGRPVTFILALAVIIIWGVTGPIFHYSDTWQLVVNTGTTIITFLMVFLIQNSQNRDGAAMQAKLDELIRALEQARGEFIGIEHLTDVQIEHIRDALERECNGDGAAADDRRSSSHSIERLRARINN